MEHAPAWGYPTTHLVVDVENHEVIAVKLTVTFLGDTEVLPEQLDQLPNEEPVAAVAVATVDEGQRIRTPPSWTLFDNTATKHGNNTAATTSSVWPKPRCFV